LERQRDPKRKKGSMIRNQLVLSWRLTSGWQPLNYCCRQKLYIWTWNAMLTIDVRRRYTILVYI
jgi:hypothetical protein